ncbi:MAG: DUF2318 domain-containing protein [Desulfovibrionaceae bacterium]|nr:DUF2318 domain-containing protein [Desulfovibrionaceae bacterium]MBF0512790.1 DUF2318 domain-containing protein [Desulfovibrionaceae bacterium]
MHRPTARFSLPAALFAVLTLTALLGLAAAPALAAGASSDESELADGKAHFYSAKIDGVTVKYFLVKTPDGVVRAAFNACDVCYPEKKGYAQDGGFMVCANCGQKFPLAKVGLIKGGCNPAPLAHAEENGKVVIGEDALRQGLQFFK